MAELGEVIVAVPETTVHVPVPTEGAVAAMVAVFTQVARDWSGPALTTSTITATVVTAEAAPQVALLAVKV